ncbi:hypothetical protein H0H92_003794, partial [Tricholoma furcatifolium]
MNVVKRSVHSEDKISDDWNQVDDSFKEKYLPLALNFAKVRLEKHTKTRRTSHKLKKVYRPQKRLKRRPRTSKLCPLHPRRSLLVSHLRRRHHFLGL